ncbi:ABC transporter substrate-binding protein [Streptomyces europaeiscabiei]|uniref:ABC transporter substrate-binding protein n=1 Tax=Streptomyces europaeiscabiei TaxID=146819 RepID=UPI000765A902|nr:ABC transporter substrate-binding protein [Streptomyces europaeiscabiei]MDX2529030.1 ABC transporter substrate-binding protein [Streptomyces europaeiscabiei]MDX2759051.1 ABC transporter substrate-binding protein [Streptomyces europaeiscabiei]MDX2767233.1 ABC transporter substrate-binding protein [Streptomyces europaeiscabiei]MDX3672574.1 ABC transporter substrate-binding protein [Streptomyces europaeiscabiei]MDX3781742.1 ABC transporter substrate-binding protein [Streptomyces europaeiscabie
MYRGAAFGLITALTLTACGGGGDSGDNPLAGDSAGGDGNAIVVGSANFPGNQLLAEIYAQALEGKGLKVTRKFDIGAREVYYDQVVKGGIGVFPEYNGALLSVAVDKNSTATSTEDINAELKEKLPSSVEILDSAAAEDKDSVTVTAETAAKYNLKSLADLKPVAGDMTIGAGSEFKTRTQGGVGLKKVYGVEFGKFQPLDAGAQTTLVKLLKDDKVQAANLYTTDPAIVTDKLVVLEDPKNLFSSQNVTPLVYKDAVNDKAKEALNAVSAKLTTEDLLEMMKKLVNDKEDADTVAEDWLTSTGLAG